MLKFLIIIGATLLFVAHVQAETNPVCTLSLDQAENRCKEKLLETYPNQYSLVKTLLNHNMEAYMQICRIPNTDPHRAILNNLNGTYPYSYSLILTLYKHNIKAYQDLNR